MTGADNTHIRHRTQPLRLIAAAGFGVLVVVSLATGNADLRLGDVVTGQISDEQLHVLLGSRAPRTAAIVLAGASLSVAGVIMQLLVRNRFVEPSTTGTSESAALGLLLAAVLVPQMPMLGRLSLALIGAMGGTGLYLLILRRIPLHDAILPPLVGLIFSGIISAVASVLAYRLDLLPSLTQWTVGRFTGIIEGRWETLLLAAVALLYAYVAADRLTIAGLGEGLSSSLGLNYRRTLATGMGAVSLVSAVVVVTCGSLPFLGLVVPNIVSRFAGDRLRTSLPWVAVAGAIFLLLCDIFARTVVAPAEIPIGVVVGVVGGVLFIVLLLRSEERV